MLILQEFFRNRDNKRLFLYTSFISILLFIVMFVTSFYTQIGRDSDFVIEMINPKVINVNFVFCSNLKLIFWNLFLGICTFGVVPIFVIGHNVYTLMVIMNVLVLNDRIESIFKLLPHGILEFFVLVHTLVLSVYFDYHIFRLIKNIVQRKKNVKSIVYWLVRMLFAHCVLLMGLLLLSVIIEFLVSMHR